MNNNELELNYEEFTRLCDENEISPDQLLDFLEGERVMVETVDNPSALNLTLRNTKDGKTVSCKFSYLRFNIKKFCRSLPSLILDYYGIKGMDIKSFIHAYRFGRTILALFSIELKKDAGNLLYALWRMDDWENAIPWEKAFEETNRIMEEVGEKAIDEDTFSKAVDTLSRYGLVELSQGKLANWEDVKNNTIRLVDHLLIKTDGRGEHED